MRRTIAVSMLLGSVAVSAGSAPQPARADTFPFAAGMQSNPGVTCFDWRDWSEEAIGLVKNNSCGMHHVAPVSWKNFYSASTNRTVRVRGKLGSSSAYIGCSLLVIDQDGFVLSQAGGSLSTVGSYSWLELTVNNVTSTSNTFLACSSSVNDAYLLMFSYEP